MDGVLIQKDRYYITEVALRKDDLMKEHNCNIHLLNGFLRLTDSCLCSVTPETEGRAG